MSKAIGIVGGTGTGKTTFTKKLIAKANKNSILVFDVNKEYKDIYPYEFNPDIDLFLEQASKLKNGVILIEDATSFFSVQGRSEILINILIAKRHTNNTIILLFHAFADFPKYLYRKCTHIVVFKTPDALKHLNVIGNDQLTEVWQRVQDRCKGHKFYSTYPPPKGVAPPYEIFSIY